MPEQPDIEISFPLDASPFTETLRATVAPAYSKGVILTPKMRDAMLDQEYKEYGKSLGLTREQTEAVVDGMPDPAHRQQIMDALLAASFAVSRKGTGDVRS